MRIGMVCPYRWDVPGGVQAHVRDLSETLIARGHEVSVLAPGDINDSTGLPPYVVPAGRAVPVPYNGSVARLQFGLISIARIRRWLREGDFDIVHVQEPIPPSLSSLTCVLADVPLVATFHVAMTHSRWLVVLDSLVQSVLERLSGRIAVSQAARRLIVEHLGHDAVVIPNGVAVARYSEASPLPEFPLGSSDPERGGLIGFIGRYEESRKGMAILLRALEKLVQTRPELILLVAGTGDAEAFVADLPDNLRRRVRMLGQVSEDEKASLLRSVDVYVAPNTGGESFGIILLEAMAAGTPIVASDLDAFRRVLDDGRAGVLYRNRNSDALADTLDRVLGDRALQGQLSEAASAVVRPYDWEIVATQILRVYEIAIAGT